jgi:hypothetical protein
VRVEVARSSCATCRWDGGRWDPSPKKRVFDIYFELFWR